MDGAEHHAGDCRPHGRLYRPGDFVGSCNEFAGKHPARKLCLGRAGQSSAHRDARQNQVHLNMNRREFIETTAIAASATLLPALSRAAEESSGKKRAIKKGIMY